MINFIHKEYNIELTDTSTVNTNEKYGTNIK